HRAAIPSRPREAVGFPIPDPASGLDDRGALRDQPFAGEPAAAVVVPVAFAALLPGAAQVGVQAAAGSLVGPDVPIDGFVTDPEAALVAGPAGELLRTPEFPELGVHTS